MVCQFLETITVIKMIKLEKIKFGCKMQPQNCRLFRHIIRLEHRYLQTFQQTQ